MQMFLKHFLVGAGLIGLAAYATPSALAQTDRDDTRVEVVEPGRTIVKEFRLDDGTVITREIVVPAQIRRVPAITATPGLGNRGLTATPSGNRGLTAPGTFTTGIEEPDRAVIGSDAVWLDPVVPVCWEDMSPANADGRQWTQDAVEQSWVKVSNIAFTGWQGCTPDSDGIRIRVAEAGPNVAELGRGLDGLEDGMTLNFTFASWGAGCAERREYCIRALAVHEFGHAIGLAHEHNRDDRALCQAEKQGPLPAFFMTNYDPTSVMNYCAKDWNNRGQLSPLDVAGIRMVYGPFSDETPALARFEADVIFVRADGTEARPAHITHDFILTDTAPQQSHTLWLCSDGDRLMELTIKAALEAGKPTIDSQAEAKLYKATDCQPGGALAGTELFARKLSEPLPAAVPAKLTFPALNRNMGETHVEIGARRTVGEERVVEDCRDCVAAAQEAVFAGPRIAAGAEEPQGSVWRETPIAYSVIAEAPLWSSTTIPVCWEGPTPIDGTSPATIEARGWTQTAVENTWEKVSDIDFTGWGDCTSDSSGLRIGVSEEGPHVEELGERLSGMPFGMMLNFSFQEWGTGCAAHREYCIKALAVHEFGHVLGLAHEHNRDDRTACEKETQGPLPAYVLSAYDPGSVMNYCSDDWNNNGRLSALDVAGIRAIYGPFSEAEPMVVGLHAYASFRPADPDAESIAREFEGRALIWDGAPDTDFAFTLCNGDDLLVDGVANVALASGSLRPIVTYRTVIYDTADCAVGGQIIEQSEGTSFLSEPGRSVSATTANFVEMIDDEAYGRSIGFSLSPSRLIGEAAGTGECTSCAAAAEEARFGPDTPPLSFSGAELHQASAVIIGGVASPWPDDFTINLDVCADAVRDGPAYGNSAWTDANVSALCDAAPTSAEPAKCFARIMEGNTSWGGGTVWVADNARNLCAGTGDASTTIACFSDRISGGAQWPDALTACDAQ